MLKLKLRHASRGINSAPETPAQADRRGGRGQPEQHVWRRRI